jgi:predicted membrane protein (TIGR00267 family)
MISIKQTKKASHHPGQALHHAQLENSNSNVGELLSDIILGGQDGLVNTLGVILGIAAASSDFRIIVAGGLAGAIAEAVSMGAVGYTSEIAERDYYLSQLQREEREIDEIPHMEIQEVRDIYAKKGFKGELLEEVVKVITSDRQVWLDTMMQQELRLNPVEANRPLKAAVLIGLSSFVGAMIPLIPFILMYWLNPHLENGIRIATYIVMAISALTLFAVGAVKSKITIGKWYKSGLQMAIIGIISALFGYVVGLLFSA